MEMTRAQAQKLLSNVPEEKSFRNHDGQIFRNLRELEKGLSSMNNEVYAYHTGAGKNDFSTWIREIIGDAKLAMDLEKATNRLDAAVKVEVRISELFSIN